MKKIFLIFSSVIFMMLNPTMSLGFTSSDTISVSHTVITIDSIDYAAKTIRGNSKLTIHSKLNGVNNISLSLLKLIVDSIKSNGSPLTYSYNDTAIRITPLSPMLTGDSIVAEIFYHGLPQMDGSGWGGFYFNGNYAFNLGVGFDANPHNFGRAWYPCIDDFVSKGKFDFHITTPDTYKAFCNGTLQSENDNLNGTKTWHWQMIQPIPSYLVSVAVAPFYTMHRTYSGIPCEYAIMASDSVATINSFTNIGTAVSSFISNFGPYPFDKIGYVMTPVVYGGMEHASSIHLSKVFVDGTINSETLFAHELAHMWWGDKVTCTTAEDMWLNEGMATFCEHIFTEAQYGNAAYINSFRTDHREVLQFAHIEDSIYWALNNVTQNFTYANLSVYQKGALTAHTLRNYMGDAKFFQGCRDYMNNKAFGNATSYQFRDELAASSGINLNDFFSDWILTPGFPHFSIDSTRIEQSGINYDVHIFTKQKRKGATHVSKMLVEFNLTDGVNDTNMTLLINATTNAFTVTLPFNPSFISVDRNEKTMDAITDYENVITSTGNKLFPETNFSLNVQNAGIASSVVRIEHNFVPPDDFKGNPGIRISDYHYWKVDGIFYSGFLSKATFTYDGSTSTSNGYLDNTLITAKEDSLVLLYRSSTAEDWTMNFSFTKNTGTSITDKRGNFVVDTVRKGEYALGYFDFSVKGISKNETKASKKLEIFPNPSTGKFTVFSPQFTIEAIEVYNVLGERIFLKAEIENQKSEIDLSNQPKGIYFVRILEGNNSYSRKLILQ